MSGPSYVRLAPGDPAPWFRVPSTTNPRYVFDTAAGRWILLCFFGSTARPEAAGVLDALQRLRGLFDDGRISFFGVTADPADRGRVRESLPGVRWFLDFDLAVSRLYGAAPLLPEPGGDGACDGACDGAGDGGRSGTYLPRLVLLDPQLRAYAIAPVGRAAGLLRLLADLPAPADHAGVDLHAPVLVVPRIFETDFCRHLVGLYEAGDVEDSGFMREVDGRTVPIRDHGFKRRSDHTIVDDAVIGGAHARIRRRLVPEIRKAFQFDVTRIERNIVACYDSEAGGFFRPHRDNTTPGTAHRRFAVTINLNAEDYDGGDLSFPEFGPRRYRAPTGGAVVFGCSLLHTVWPVTRGRRFAYLPFLYDEAAARIREANLWSLAEGAMAAAGAVPQQTGSLSA